MTRKMKNFFFGRLGRKPGGEISPDEIFLDSSNLPNFDRERFEGRLERPISRQALNFLLFFFLLLTSLFSFRLWFLQIKSGEAYLAKSEQNRLRYNYLFSSRGIIYDRRGEPLAFNVENQENPEFSQRRYSTVQGLAHLLGYVKYPAKDKAGFYWETDFVGKDGVENSYGQLLLGDNGLQIVEIDALDRVQAKNVVRRPRDGDNLILSVDSAVQQELFKIIRTTAGQFNYQAGAGVLMDVATGELLAVVSFPEYDSNVLSQGKDAEAVSAFLNDQHNPFINRSLGGLYAPGSIIKPFLAAGILNEKLIDPQKQILSTGSLTIANPYFPDQPTVFRDWRAHGLVDLIDALAVSSNVYFYYLGGGYGEQKGLGIGGIEKYARLFGLGETTGVDLPGESPGTVPNPEWKKANFDGEPWRLGDTYNSAIGQYGFQVTPLQIVRAMAAVANGGFLLQPTVQLGKKTEKSALAINGGALATVREGLRQAVERGTAAGLRIPSLSLAAKTGTAQVGRQYVNSWVTGFFPYDNPKFAFAVVMERGPVNSTVGGVYVMRQLFDWLSVNRPEYLK